jgi:ATP-dependent DNA helicase PIF1
MQQLFDAIDAALKDENSTFLGLLQGRAGSGKSTFAKYLAAYCRSLGKICLGCASTGLASNVYDDFTTAHSLFAIPVIDDAEEYDQENDIECKLHLPAYEQRAELIKAAKLIIWDEISSQHMKDVNAVLKATHYFKGKVVLFIGDGLQITPVVKFGSKEEILKASIYCGGRTSIPNLQVFKFTKNLRLQRGDTDPEQVEYIKMLDEISTNQYDSSRFPKSIELMFDDAWYEDDPVARRSGRKGIAFPTHQVKRLSTAEEVVDFAFPDGFDPETMHKSCILATINEQVEMWNQKVQALNKADAHDLYSWDSMEDLVDDPHGYIQSMINEQVMNDVNDPGNCPPHKLTLKVGDICILMRAVNKEEKFSTNTRVRVERISKNTVRVQSLANPNKFVTLPRFIFKIKLNIGRGYEMTRHQFPLRLAYSMSINKSQGQQYLRCVADLTKFCFSHGHLNVALSRITDPANMAIFVNDGDWDQNENRIWTINVVYKEILNAVV